MTTDDFEVIAIKRIEELPRNEEYFELQKKCAEVFAKGDYLLYSDLTCQLQCMAELACYTQGHNDACTRDCTRKQEMRYVFV